jgi:hypothetical protein
VHLVTWFGGFVGTERVKNQNDHGLGGLKGWGTWMILPEVIHGTGETATTACPAPNSRSLVVDVPESNL